MPYSVMIQEYNAASVLCRSYCPDTLTLFDFPIDAKAHLLALVTDELAAAVVTTGTWLDADTLEIVQPTQPVSQNRRRFQVVLVESVD